MRKVLYEENGNKVTLGYPEHLHESPIRVEEIGHSTRSPGYRSKILSRNCFVIHFLLSGKGMYQSSRIEAPCAFLMTPESTQLYEVECDPSAPQWEHYWILFTGSAAKTFLQNAGFQVVPHVYSCSYIPQAIQILEELFDSANHIGLDDHNLMLSGLFRIFSLHAASVPTEKFSVESPNKTVQAVYAYIQEHYAENLREDDLAAHVHLSTKHMHFVFKRETGSTPMRYLNFYRVKCAKKLLLSEELPISNVADAVGFSDPNYFCCVFRKFCNGVTPTEYRKKHSRQSSL